MTLPLSGKMLRHLTVVSVLLSGCQTHADGQSPSELEPNPRLRVGQASRTSELTESEKDQARASFGVLGILNAVGKK